MSGLASVALCLALVAAAPASQEIAISFAFPDGSTRSTTVTLDEVEKLTGQRPAYTLLPWVHAALKKLDLPHVSSKVEGGIALTSIGGIANGSRGTWVYAVNGIASPYQLSTQTIEDARTVAFSYRPR